MLLFLAAIGVFAIGFVMWNSHQSAQERQRALAREAEEEAERQRQTKALSEASPLVTFSGLGELADLRAKVQDCIADFELLRTFDDVNAWDTAADDLVSRMSRLQESARAFAEEAQRALEDAPGASWAARELTRRQLRAAEDVASKLAEDIDALAERIDMTPNSKKEQMAVLRDLRAQKKDLAAQKREHRANAAEIRREAREASAAAEPTGWVSTYDRRIAAAERREIRRRKEAALQPHESAAAAIERQILALDRRIAWLARFGEE